MTLVVYMGLEVGGCSLFADPSGYVGHITLANTNPRIVLLDERPCIREDHQPLYACSSSRMEPLVGAASAVAAGIAVGLAAIGPGIGQGQAAAYRLRMNLGIQVLLYDVRGLLLLSFAFMESLCIYGLVEHSCWWRLHQVDLQHLSSPSRCYVCWVGGVTIRRRLDSYLAVSWVALSLAYDGFVLLVCRYRWM